MSRIFALIICTFFAIPALSFETTARNAYLIDTSTGTVMFDKASDQSVPPASMSKLMTISLLFKALKDGTVSMDTKFPVSEKAWAMGGSKMFVENGSQVSVEDLIQGIIVQSGNDACVVVAEGLAGSEDKFAEMMNAYATELGLTNSSFGNASGWPDPRQKMSAHDLAKLAYYLQQNYPEYWHYFSEREFTYNGITQPNRNPILSSVEGANGLKTGHTEEAGYGLVGSVERNNRSVIFVLMGMQTEAERATEAERIATWALSNFVSKTYFDNGEPMIKAKTWLASQPEIGLTTADGLTTLEPIAGASNVKVKANFYEPITAPLPKGTEVGTITVQSDSFPEYTLPLITSEALERGGFFEPIWQCDDKLGFAHDLFCEPIVFITLEGVDGSGKSLQARLIAQELEKRGIAPLLTREPGGTQGAEALRNLVLNGDTDRWSAMSETLIFTAARRDHCERVIWPALERGEIVLCDRFADSTLLYQGLASDEMAEAVKAIHQIAIHTTPDLTLIFDIDPEKAFARMGKRGDAEMRFEGHGLEFQRQRRVGFLQIAHDEPERCAVINADQDIQSVTQSCLEAILPKLKL